MATPSAPNGCETAIGDEYFCSPVIINFDSPSHVTAGFGNPRTAKVSRSNPTDDDLALIGDLPKLKQLHYRDELSLTTDCDTSRV